MSRESRKIRCELFHCSKEVWVGYGAWDGPVVEVCDKHFEVLHLMTLEQRKEYLKKAIGRKRLRSEN